MHKNIDHPVIEKIIENGPHMSWLRQGTIFLTKHGSQAYNLAIEGVSDTDYKGITTVPKQYLYGTLNNFEQAELKSPNPDAAIYNIKKFFALLTANNPSLMEVLFTEPEDHLYRDDLAEIIIGARDRFLSKRVRYSFSGYSVSQINRAKLHRQYLLNPPKGYLTRKEMGLPEQTLIPQDQMLAAEADIKKELDKLNFDFLEEVSEPVKIGIRSAMTTMLAELKITVDDQWLSACRKIGLSDNFIEIMQKERAYKNQKSQWDKYQEWKKNRNPVRAAMEEKFGFDGKNMLHAIRLSRMCCEMLEHGKVIVRRTDDRDDLLSIRLGGWTYDEIMEEAEMLDVKAGELYKTSELPNTPDFKYLDNLCINIVEKALGRF